MNRLNAKRIGVLAASLLFGLAVAGPVTFSSIPIINSAGQPVVQVVVGSTAKISDGIVAANIAAAIGSLSFTSTPITATVGNTAAVKCVVTTPTCTITNQQVFLGVSGTTAPAGTYGFTALIGSILSRAVVLGVPQFTKGLQASSTGYSFGRGFTTTNSPADSPYTATGSVPTSTSASASSNGGGLSFTSFTTSSSDNIMQIGNAQFPALLATSGPYGESEYLWLTGFPVYNQQTTPSVVNFAVINMGGAYQASFTTPIHEPYYVTGGGSGSGTAAGTNAVNNAAITLLGQSWTIVSYSLPSGTTSSSTVSTQGGKLGLAQSLVPLSTVYVGKNLTSGPYTVQLADLGTASSAGVSPAAINLYYKGVLTNSTSIWPANTVKFNVTATTQVFIKVNQTFAGLYAYQKWAKIQMYSNVYNITNGQTFNQTRDPGWLVNLLWLNTSGSGNHNTDLSGIIVYNATPLSTMTPGQSFTFIQSPKTWKVTLVGDTVGTNFDAVTISSVFASSVNYANSPTGTSGGLGNINNITEPSQELVVASSIPTAFNIGGIATSTATYLLTPYTLKELNTSITSNVLAAGAGQPVNVFVTIASGYTTSNYITSTNPLLVTVSGFSTNTASSATSTTLTFNSNSFGVNALATSGNFFNITAIKLSRALPGITVAVNGTALSDTFVGNVPYSNTIVAGNVPVLSAQTSGTATSAVTGNIVLATAVSGVNSIAFSNTIPSGGTIGITGNVAITSANVVNAISTNPFTLNGNLIVANTVLPLLSPTSKAIGNVIISGNILVQNTNIALTANTATVNTLSAATGFLTVTANVPVSSLTVVGNFMLSANIPTATTVTAGPIGIVTFSPTNVIVTSSSSANGQAGLATLTTGTTPQLIYSQASSGKVYYGTTSGATLQYYQPGQTSVPFTMSTTSPVIFSSTNPLTDFWTYTVNEINVVANTASTDAFSFNIVNATSGVAASPLFQLNYSTTNTRNNMTYLAYTGTSGVNAQAGFRSERGSKIVSIGSTSLSLNLAKAVDTLSFVVGPVNTTVTTTKKTIGPYGVGQTTSLTNITIANVTATCSFTTTSCSVTGLSNVTGVPSASAVTTPVKLNTAASPLVVLDSNANAASTLVVVGSKFVNSVASQIFTQNPSLASSFGPTSVVVQAFGTNRVLVAGYYANQTVAAGNQFIAALLSATS